MSPLTVRDRLRVLRAAERDLGRPLVTASERELAGWLANPAWRPWTRCSYDSHLRSWYRWLVEHTVIDWSPMTRLRTPRRPHSAGRPCTYQQWRVLMGGLPEPYRLWAVLMAGAGLRCCDLAQLRREHITPEHVWIRRSKGGSSRLVATHPFLWLCVRALPPGPVARFRDGRPAHAKAISEACGRAFRRLGVEVTAHQLRHLFATGMRDAGVDLVVISDQMGHHSLDYTRGYLRIGEREGADAVRALPFFAEAC